MRIGTGLIGGLDAEILELADGGLPIIVTDSNVDRAWPDLLRGTPRLVFPAGEASKTRETWGTLTDRLLDIGIDRRTLLVAIGGGVTCDLAGFVAATALRGLRWVAVPTTTLAMLDASVGGKTGVDTTHGKNLVGAFHPPLAVLIDPAFLSTLPGETCREGFAEAVKHAAIADARHADWIEEHGGALRERDEEVVAALVLRSVTIKGAIVAGDEHERGQRAILNAGHTAAHAIEQATGYAVPHGHAVAIGLVAETRLAERIGLAEAGTASRLASLLERLGLPTEPPEGLERDTLISAMRRDKKNRAAAVHAALLAQIGRVARGPDGGWTHDIDPNQLAELLTPQRSS